MFGISQASNLEKLTSAVPQARLASAFSKALVRTGNSFKQLFHKHPAALASGSKPAVTVDHVDTRYLQKGKPVFGPHLSGPALEHARQQVNMLLLKKEHLVEAEKHILQPGSQSSITAGQMKTLLNAINSLLPAWIAGNVAASQGRALDLGRKALERDVDTFAEKLEKQALNDLKTALDDALKQGKADDPQSMQQIARLSEISTLLMRAGQNHG